MADNYLERKFEEHNASHITKRKSTPKQHRERRVFVTGGAKGIGRAIVKSLRTAGNRVAFCDIDTQAGEDLALHTGTKFYNIDVSDVHALEECMQELFRLWGDIDIVINNVGITEFAPLTETDAATFDHVMAVNVRSAFVTSQTLAKHRKILPAPNPYGGRIINLCSTRQKMSEAGTEAYSASKGAILSLTHALAMSLAEFRITVNSISPGWIETGDYENLSATDHNQHPSGRVGRPTDIARICRFLCEDDNDFINGENIVADGGMTCKMIYQ